ncbi:MAG: methylmalonyl-CoA mutase family protein [candidate division Zixibacteria bacterium]|nr:methylmalonyl-CoA mutase family protein [candidate division Zixibacteria bacterium]
MKDKKEDFFTSSEIRVKELYTPEDLLDFDFKRDLGHPGKYPFTRGVQKDMYRGHLWTMRQYAGFGTASETNKRFRYLLKQGQTGLSVAFDLPTQIGYDSGHPLSSGEVGKTGVAIDTLEDMEILFDKIPLDKVSTSMTINATASILLAMYVALARKQNVPLKLLSGTVQNDILKEYIARGTYIFPPRPSMRLTTDIFKYAYENLPKFNSISVSGYHIREAGANAVQEIAFTLANGITYVQEAVNSGLNVNSFGKRISFFLNAHSNFLEEIAKFRAARRLWAKMMKEKFGAEEDSCKLRFHTQTAGCTLTAQQPENNIVRVAFQALSSVLGGTQSLHTNSMDEALSLPSEKAAEVALRTQQIIAYESGISSTVDPLAGSYFIESLTNNLEKEAKKYIDYIEQNGGALWAVESGYYQKEIQKSAYEHQKMVESGDRVIVGVNKFETKTEKEKRKKIFKISKKATSGQIKRLKDVKKRRDNNKVKASLEELKNKVNTEENLMYPIIECVEANASIGEICQVLKDVWGEYEQKVII